jgi:hypothetical protein
MSLIPESALNGLVVVGQRKIAGGLQPVGRAADRDFLGVNSFARPLSSAFLIVALATGGNLVI